MIVFYQEFFLTLQPEYDLIFDIMKRITILLASAAMLLSTQANAQLLQSLLGSATGSSTTGNTITNLISSLAGTVYSAPISLNGTYIYNGVAVSVSSSEGGVLSNLAGTAVTSGIESKIDARLAQFGIQPGLFTFVFTPNADNAGGDFVCYVKSIPINGTFTVGQEEKTITLQFGKMMKFLSMTGNLNSTLTGAEMVFPANKMLTFLKKIASFAGQYSSTISTITGLADGYDNLKLGFKLAKQ